MIISPNRKFVFVHLQKCAGTSIERALDACLKPNDLVLGSTPSGEKFQPFFRKLIGLAKHSTAAQAQAQLGSGPWKNWFTFGFVRHPLDRLRSLYSYRKTLIERLPLTPAELAAYQADGKLPDRAPYNYPGITAALESADFNAFVLHPATWKDPAAHAMWRSLCDAKGQLLVKFVGKVENLAQDWAVVKEKLEIDLEVGHHNASAPTTIPKALNLSAEAWSRLETKCHRDCEIFGYKLRESQLR